MAVNSGKKEIKTQLTFSNYGEKRVKGLIEISDLLIIILNKLPHRCLFFLMIKRLILTTCRNKLHWYKTSLSTSRTSLSWYQTVRAVTLALILIGLNKTVVPFYTMKQTSRWWGWSNYAINFDYNIFFISRFMHRFIRC